MRTQSLLRILLLAAILIVGWWLSVRREGGAPRTSHTVTSAPSEQAILEAFRERKSDVWVEAEGVVERTLADDLQGSRHQRFIVRLRGGHTVLVSHNIDLAQRVPLQQTDVVSFRGEYEWNAQGGVVHWTHHDPAERFEGGWIRHQGTLYR